jgi:hypothetical protein
MDTPELVKSMARKAHEIWWTTYFESLLSIIHTKKRQARRK